MPREPGKRYKWQCKKCNAKHTNGLLFCVECGKKRGNSMKKCARKGKECRGRVVKYLGHNLCTYHRHKSRGFVK